METFYRVQDATGIGPYQNPDFAYTMGHQHARDYLGHPSPATSGSYYMNRTELGGFRTMQQLFAWFGGWLPVLLRKGYRVVKVDGNLKYEDSCQVVFETAKVRDCQRETISWRVARDARNPEYPTNTKARNLTVLSLTGTNVCALFA